MAKKKIRLIARLDVKDTNLVKGIQLEGLRKLGDPNLFAREYYEQGIDELLYIDIVASLYNRNNLSDIVRKTVDDVYIPVCVGGGLRSVEDVRHILSMGADKVAINTAAIKRPELITEVANAFGSQCMVLSIQAKRNRTWPGKWEAYYDNGRAHSGYDVVEWAKRGVALGAGEILLMSVDNEGLQRGMDLELIEAVTKAVSIPVICGGGVVRSRSHKEFQEFARRLDAPVAITVMGGGGVSGRDVMTTGMIGMHGSVASNMACDNCDLLIAVGCRFSDRVALKPETFAHQAKIVHVDIDRAEINKNVQTDHHIIGDAKQVLNLLLERLPQYEHKEWKDFVLSFPRETEYGESESVLTPKQVLSTIARKCPQDSIVATDVGQHQMWAIQHLHFDYPGQLLTSGGFGTMGFGLGAAIGAKQGNPDKTVIHITGDGCFRMNGNELATVAYYGLPVITVIFNNRNLGMVRQWQSLIYDHRYSQTSLENRSPDFVKFADAFGLKGRRVTQPSELEEAITEALAESAQGRGYVIDCAINADEMVHPMVNGGHHITEFLLS